nr:mini-chromosome maintenance complex-binding protein-like [Cherax quadricarinatus]
MVLGGGGGWRVLEDSNRWEATGVKQPVGDKTQVSGSRGPRSHHSSVSARLQTTVQLVFIECYNRLDANSGLEVHRIISKKSGLAVPWVNETPLHDLRPNQVVALRGGARIFDKGFFLDLLNVNILKCYFKPFLSLCGRGKNIETDSPVWGTGARLILYCVPVPGENEWLKKVLQDINPCTLGESSSNRYSKKNEDSKQSLMVKKSQQPGGFMRCLRARAKDSKPFLALGNVINWQKADYDFQYHQIEQHTNIPVLILSEGRAMITSDVEVRLEPKHTNVSTAFTQIHSKLTPDLLQRLRSYLTTARLMSYTLSDEMQKMVQDDFVDSRKNENGITASDLHSLLVLARLVAVSCGETSLTPDIWRSVKILGNEQKLRLNVSSH